MAIRRLHGLLLVGLLVLPWTIAHPAAPEEDADEKVLREAKVGTDAASLLAFFRRQTLDEDSRKHVEALVRQLGSDQFARREAASRELVQRGAPVRPFLRAARSDPDAEIARRATECLEEIDSGPGLGLPTAAIHLLAHRRPAGAVAALLAYLPFADDGGIEEEVRAALLSLLPEGRPPDESLASALADRHPLVRGAAAYALGRKGDAARRAAVRPLLKDPDASVRWWAAQGLLAAHERAAVAALIQLLDEAPLELASQAEEALCLLAGDQSPPLSIFDNGTEGRRKCRDAWLAWWNAHAGEVDPARADGRQLLGLTIGIEFNTGRVWECGRDGTTRWELTNLAGPMEGQVLSGSRVLVAESHAHTVRERDFKGRILWEKKIDADPTGCQRLPNGNTFVSTYTSVMEFDRDGKQLYSFRLPSPSNAIRKHRNGHVVYAVDDAIVEVDTAGNRVRSVPLPSQAMYVGIQELRGDHFLVANSSSGRVLEVDGKGKIVWEGKVGGACGVWRVPTGNTLVATNGRIVELDRAGKKVWEVASRGYVRRVHRR